MNAVTWTISNGQPTATTVITSTTTSKYGPFSRHKAILAIPNSPESIQSLTTVAVYTIIYPTTDVTTTSTVMYISASSTTYAACASDNLVTHANGDNGIALTFSTKAGSQDIMVDGINDAYDCCVPCQTYAGDCGFYNFATGYCGLNVFDTCDPSSFVGNYQTSNQDANGVVGFTVGNGPCGQAMDDGNF